MRVSECDSLITRAREAKINYDTIFVEIAYRLQTFVTVSNEVPCLTEDYKQKKTKSIPGCKIQISRRIEI